MKLVCLEPLGTEEELLRGKIAEKSPNLEMVFYKDRREDEEILIERSQDAEILLFSNIPFGEKVLKECKKLKFICAAFTGVDHIDMEYCHKNGITVSNCAGYSTQAVAELALGMAVSLARNIRTEDARCKEGLAKSAAGIELCGSVFGIIGLGNIGMQTAKLASAFGCKVLAYSRTQKNAEGVEFVSKDELLEKSDFVSLHVPLNADTRGLIGDSELLKMKSSAYLINTARGPVVDAAALKKALEKGKIAGAAVDVFDREPPLGADYPLLSAPNLLLTPHVGFATKQAFIKRADIAADVIAAYMSGNPINVM